MRIIRTGLMAATASAAIVAAAAKCELQERIDRAKPGDVVEIDMGVHMLETTLYVTNGVSLKMHKSAILRAAKPMDYVLVVDCASQWRPKKEGKPGYSNFAAERREEDYNLFVTGGQLDGNGLASCMRLDNYKHFTLRDVTFLNGKKYGLAIDTAGHGYELIAENLYFKTVMKGLAGNTAVYTMGGDSHYTDCVVVDYTVGFHLARGGSNRLTRCHVWVGPVAEMLKGSINFHIGDSSAILRDCYADTGETGFLISGNDVRLLGCQYFSNPVFNLDRITMIDHRRGNLYVSECGFVKMMEHDVKVYDGIGSVVWNNCIYSNFKDTDDTPGRIVFPKADKSRVHLAQ